MEPPAQVEACICRLESPPFSVSLYSMSLGKKIGTFTLGNLKDIETVYPAARVFYTAARNAHVFFLKLQQFGIGGKDVVVPPIELEMHPEKKKWICRQNIYCEWPLSDNSTTEKIVTHQWVHSFFKEQPANLEHQAVLQGLADTMAVVCYVWNHKKEVAITDSNVWNMGALRDFSSEKKYSTYQDPSATMGSERVRILVENSKIFTHAHFRAQFVLKKTNPQPIPLLFAQLLCLAKLNTQNDCRFRTFAQQEIVSVHPYHPEISQALFDSYRQVGITQLQLPQQRSRSSHSNNAPAHVVDGVVSVAGMALVEGLVTAPLLACTVS
jgi:hypothetical protein